MIDSYWQWMAGLVLGLAVLLIPVIGWRLYLHTLPKPDVDVATESAREPTPCHPDLHDQVDMILESIEQEEFERLYGRLRWHTDVAMQRGKGQLL